MVSVDFNAMVKGATIEALTWKQVRDEVALVNPDLAVAIDSVDPGQEYRLYRCRYPYGSEILQKGRCFLPAVHGHLVAFEDAKLETSIKEDLSYNHCGLPAGLVVKGVAELFYDANFKVGSFGLFHPGHLFGVDLLLEEATLTSHPAFLWGFTAGARSVLMLPKISEAISHNYLKRTFQIHIDKPEGFIDHWQVFRQLANHKALAKEPWSCEMLFFSKAWFSHRDSADPAWQSFYYQLLKQSRLKTRYLRNLIFWNCIYGLLSTNAGMKISAYISETIKHMFAMGVGALPGFAPAIDETALPVKLIQQVYLDVYRLKQYLPIIMQPQLFDVRESQPRPIYYSLQCSSSLGLTPKAVNGASAMVELNEIELLFNKYQEMLLDPALNIDRTDIHCFAQQGQVDYFHSSVPEHPMIKEVSDLLAYDESFKIILANNKTNKTFPETSSFLRGCIRISKK